ncbi:hypothetical protein [Nocardioides sp.]|uniref:hypothetical protein n=1 Tax=Nocardioides sp. TaxID=35761 RepID=UPI003D09AE7D
MAFPERPLLRPGTLVTRRGDGHLQIGLDAPRAMVVPDDGDTRRFLDGLASGGFPEVTPMVARLADALLEHGLLIDAVDFRASLDQRPQAAQSVAATFAHGNLEGGRLLTRRAERPVRVEVCLPPADAGLDWLGLATGLLSLQGVPDAGTPVVHLVIHGGEPDRERVDEFARTEQPHLLLSASEGFVNLGPFVVPGVTACLRCVDAHRGELDPRRALVVEQHAHARGPRPDGLPMPLDPAVMTAAVAWAIRDVVSFVDDEMPTTWSSTIRFGPGMQQAHTPWQRHARCGCSWAQVQPPPYDENGIEATG